MPKKKSRREAPSAIEAGKLETRCRELEAHIAKLTKRDGKRGPSQLFVDEKWVATRLGMSVKYLQKLRYANEGPPFYKFGGAIRYRIRDIRAYIEQCKKTK